MPNSKSQIIIIEPNLKSEFGHPFSVMNAISKERHKIKAESISLVGNKKMDTTLRKKIGVMPVATQGCFESIKWEPVALYLENFLRRIPSYESILVIFTTAHFNEIKAVAKLSMKFPTVQFFLHIHQWYNPNLKLENLSSSKKKLLDHKYGKIISILDPKRVTLGVTPAPELYHKIKKIFPSVKIFPVPQEIPVIKKKTFSDDITVGFFGDNRKEKGLMILLLAIKQINPRLKFKFILQMLEPRYYGHNARAYRLIQKSIAADKRVKPILHGLPKVSYYRYLTSCDFIALPYDPRYYDIRYSAVAEECACLGIPVVTFKDNSIGKKVTEHLQSGLLVSFSPEIQKSADNFAKMIKKLPNKLKTFRHQKGKDIISGSDYINLILEHV